MGAFPEPGPLSMAQIQLIVGTVMGTALDVAQAVAALLTAKGHRVQVNESFQAGDLTRNPDELWLICTSNTGMGDLPANIAPLHLHLVRDCPAIAGRRYGLINLGDSSYPDFAQAGRTLDEALADLGAQRIDEPLVIDAIYDDDPEAVAVEWAERWSHHL